MLKNWKTTLAGLVTLAMTAASALHFISEAQAASIMALAVSFGLLAAKDSNVTGGTVKQPTVHNPPTLL